MKKVLTLVTVILLLASLGQMAAAQTCDSGVCGADSAPLLIPFDFVSCAPAGSTATGTVGAVNDRDTCRKLGSYPGYVWTTQPTIGNWGAFGTATGVPAYWSWTKTDVPAGVNHITFTAYDAVTTCDYYTSENQDFDIEFHGVKPDPITGPGTWCMNASVYMNAAPNISHDESMLTWYKKLKTQDETAYTTVLGTGSVLATAPAAAGEYTYGVRAERTNPSLQSPWADGEQKEVELTEPENRVCDSASGGCGNCDGGKGACAVPMPRFQDLYVRMPDIPCKTFGPIAQMGGDGSDSENCQPEVAVFRYASIDPTNHPDLWHWHYYTSCGTVMCLTSTAMGLNGNENPKSIACCLDTLTRHGDPSAPTGWTYTATTPDGTVYNLGGGTGGYGTIPNDTKGRIPSITYPNGRTLARGEWYQDEEDKWCQDITDTAPNNYEYGTWHYKFDSRYGIVVSATSPSGVVTTIERTSGKITGVSIDGNSKVSDYEVTYAYDGSDRLSGVLDDQGHTHYAYDTNKVTVTKEDTNESVISTVEYTSTSTTTTVTQTFPNDSTKDRATEQEYILDNDGAKKYVYKVTDPLGNITRYSMYVPESWEPRLESDGLIEGTDFESTTNTIMYGQVWRVTTGFKDGVPMLETDSRLRKTTTHYDTDTGQVEWVEYPAVTAIPVLDGSNQPVTSLSPDTSTSSVTPKEIYVYNGALLTSSIDLSGKQTTYGYDGSNRVTSVTEGGTLVKSLTYYPNDPEHQHGQDGLLQSETVSGIDGSENYVKTYEYYETVGGVEKLRNGATRVTYRYFDPNTSSYTTATQSTHYDDDGRVLSTTDAQSRTISYDLTIDGSGNKTETTTYVNGANSVSLVTESDCCHVLSTTDENNKTTYYDYDAVGRLTKTWTSLSGQSANAPLVQNEYDEFGSVWRVTTRSDAGTIRQTSYTFDKLGRVTAVDNPSPLGDEAFGYDDYGNKLWKQDGKGVYTLYKYDTLNRVTDVYYNYTGGFSPISYPGSADVSYTYYGGSSIRAKAIDSVGTSKYAYNLLRQLSTYTAPQPSNRTVTYTYNALGEKTSEAYGGSTISYEYFANGWLKNVKKGTSTIASYTYDSAGNRTRVDFGNGTYQVFDYDTDPRYRLANIDYAYACEGSGVQVRGTLDVTRDNAGNPLTWGNDDYKKAYAYDDNNRLATAALPGNSTATYTYDWVGNRLGTGYTYNAADQMTASPGKNYTYDGNGNMLTGTMNFSYTYTNLVSTAGGTSMTWDSMGNRVSFTTAGSATYQFVYDPSAGIPAMVEEVTPGGSVYYVREPNGALIARITGTGETQTTTYYHFDELGSTLFLTDPGGILTDKYTYDTWGNVTSHVGSTSQPYQFVGQLGYYTHTQESGFKLLQLGVRLYDPEMGRFMQRDPMRQGASHYVYCSDIPTGIGDPTGLWALSPIGDGWSDAMYYFFNWELGWGESWHGYDGSDYRTKQMQESWGVWIARNQVAWSCSFGGPTSGEVAFTTIMGIGEALRIGWRNGTTFQVGAYKLYWQIDCKKGKARYQIYNKSGRVSFWFHLPWVRDIPRNPWEWFHSPESDVYQKFWWDEPLPVGCCCGGR